MRTARSTTRTIAVVVAAMLALAALGGCTRTTIKPSEPSHGGIVAPVETKAVFPVTVTDDASRTVTLDAAAQRVVSLAPSNTEIVAGLDEFDRIVGVTTYDDYPVEVAGVAKMGDFTTPNLEAIAAAEPDLILVTGGVQAELLGRLESMGADVLVVDPQNLEGVYRAVVLVATALGTPTKGEEVVAGMRSELERIRARIGDARPVSCFVEIGWNPLWTAGQGTLLDDLIVQAGGRNVVKQAGYVGYSTEQLLKDQPEAYLGTRSSIGDLKGLSRRPGYARLGAVADSMTAALDDNLVSRPGPRVVQGVAEIAKALHPDRFQ